MPAPCPLAVTMPSQGGLRRPHQSGCVRAHAAPPSMQIAPRGAAANRPEARGATGFGALRLGSHISGWDSSGWVLTPAFASPPPG